MDTKISTPGTEQSSLSQNESQTDRDTRAASVAQAMMDSKASGEMLDAVRKSLDQKKKERDFASIKKRAPFDVVLDRHEAKYIIPKALVPRIREYIRPFCEPDPHGEGDPPEYVITTLQLDTPNLALHHAKENDALNRFKLRARTYGDPVGSGPVFLETKRKFRGTIMKSRASIPFDKWGKQLFGNDIIKGITFKSSKEAEGFYQFIRLTKEIGAIPAALIRYRRESYFGKMERYARVTFDSKLEYQPATSWDSWGRDGKWLTMDTSLIQNQEYNFSGVVLEIKTVSDAPLWMVNLVMEFDLVRIGHCKYSNALWAESLFRGTPETPMYDITLMRYL